MSEVPVGRTSIANRTLTLNVGDEAPDFQLTSSSNVEYKLSQFRGQKNVVMMFLPAAFTSV